MSKWNKEAIRRIGGAKLVCVGRIGNVGRRAFAMRNEEMQKRCKPGFKFRFEFLFRFSYRTGCSLIPAQAQAGSPLLAELAEARTEPIRTVTSEPIPGTKLPLVGLYRLTGPCVSWLPTTQRMACQGRARDGGP